MSRGLRLARRPLLAPRMLNPSQVSGCTGWWKADSEAYADADLVGTFTDRSGNGLDMTSTTTNRPTFKTNIVNGLPVVRFANAHKLTGVAISNFMTASALTAFAVFSATTIDTNTGTLQANDPVIADADGYHGFYLRSVPNAYAFVYDGVRRSSGNITIATATWYIAEIRHDSGSVYARINGGTEIGGAGGTLPDLTTLLQFGRSPSSTFLDGDLAEVAYFNVSLGPAQRQAIRRYLGFKYGITTS